MRIRALQTIVNILLSFVNNSFCSNTKRSFMKTLLIKYNVHKFSSSNMTNNMLVDDPLCNGVEVF
jgi:hypothetical protein